MSETREHFAFELIRTLKLGVGPLEAGWWITMPDGQRYDMTDRDLDHAIMEAVRLHLKRRDHGAEREQPDRMLTATETAERLGVAKRWVYRHSAQLPFAKRLGAGTVRFSERGIEAWVAARGMDAMLDG